MCDDCLLIMASMTPALEEVAMQWTNELSRVSSDLAIASRNLQKDFLMLSKAAADQQDDSNRYVDTLYKCLVYAFDDGKVINI